MVSGRHLGFRLDRPRTPARDRLLRSGSGGHDSQTQRIVVSLLVQRSDRELGDHPRARHLRADAECVHIAERDRRGEDGALRLLQYSGAAAVRLAAVVRAGARVRRSARPLELSRRPTRHTFPLRRDSLGGSGSCRLVRQDHARERYVARKNFLERTVRHGRRSLRHTLAYQLRGRSAYGRLTPSPSPLVVNDGARRTHAGPTKSSMRTMLGGSAFLDARFREAVSAIDSGDVATLQRLVTENPAPVRHRLAA